MGVKFLLSAVCKSALLFIAVLSLCGAAEIKLDQSTPVFEKADFFSKTKGVLEPGSYQIKGAVKRVFSVKHPIAYYHDFAELEQGGFVSAEIGTTPEGEVFSLPSSGSAAMALLAVLMALWGGLLYVFIKGRKEGSILPDSRSETCCLIFLAVLVRQILLLYEVSFWGNALPCATDEPGYFKTVYDMLQGNFSGPWNFTVGLGLLYLPFVWLTGAREFYDIAIAFTYFDGFVIAPAALGVCFPVLKGFGVKKYYAFTAVLLWALYPFFIYHAELWGKLHFAPLWALPSSWEGVADWWRFYAVCINAGFNAMSDTPGLLAVLCTMLAAQKVSPVPRNIFLIGMGYGFCCLIRINYIFFAPVLAWICLEKMEERHIPMLLKTALAAAGGFLTVFIWQLLINFHHFSDPLTFGYSLHYLDFPPEKRPDTGFNWSTLWELRHIKFLLGANKLLMTAGIAGLLFTKERSARIALTLAAVPLILFFLGYTHTYCDARRFILMAFPMLLAAFCAGCSSFFPLEGTGWKRYLPPGIFPVMVILWQFPAEIYAICLCLLLLRTLFDLQQELWRGILRK